MGNRAEYRQWAQGKRSGGPQSTQLPLPSLNRKVIQQEVKISFVTQTMNRQGEH